MSKDIYIIGAGTYGEVMYELAISLGYSVNGFYDEDESLYKKEVMSNCKVLGKFSAFPRNKIKNKSFIVAIGDNKVRKNIMENIIKYKGDLPSLVHLSATISPTAKIGKGVYIHAKSYIWTKVTIENFSIISPHVTVAHHTSIGKACLISTQSAIGASVVIEDEAFIGMASTVMTGVKRVGRNAVIGAGAVVIDDVDMESTNVGVPAKKIK